MTPRARLWRRIVVGLLLTVIALCAMVPWAAHVIIRRQLQSLVAEKLDARLAVGSIEYIYPFGLVLTDAIITTQAPGRSPVELLTIPRLEVTLAHWPLSEGADCR